MTLTTSKPTPQAKTPTLWETGKDRHLRPCIWMQAGVATKKNCNNFFDCTSCKYDEAMEKNARAGKHLTWQDAMRMRGSKDRTCRHALTGRTDHRACPMNYNCSRCDFDQLFEDTLSPGVGHESLKMGEVKGFQIPGGYYFHAGHTWACIESGGIIRVGMDDFTFRVLGGPDGFHLPLTGQELNRGTPGWGMKQKTDHAHVLSPVNGVITRVNPKIGKTPGISEKEPYGSGWLFTVHNVNIKHAMKDLMTGDDSLTWLNDEVTTLENMIEDVAGPLSADGGLLTRDILGALPALGWNNLTRTFLKT